MASSHTDMEENLRCSICFEIFKDPVVLSCSHSFCKMCLESSWCQKQVKECPLCRHVAKRSPLKNLALKGVCESFMEEKRRRISAQSQDVLCGVHGSKYELFCTDDQKLVCLICVSQEHKEHNFCSINKAAEEHRNKLQKPLHELESKLQTLISEKSRFATIPRKLQIQGQQTEMQIKEEFKKLYQFLREEEVARISALRDEQKSKREKIMEKIAEVEGLHTSLSERIKNIKDDLEHDESLFLQNFRDTEERVKFALPDPKLDSGSLIDVAKHMGNLRYRVWEKMKHLCPYYPVILDPNTKTSNLEVSPDLTSVACSGTSLLNSPEKRSCYILGSEGFSSGVHTWQVDLEAFSYITLHSYTMAFDYLR
ncbi:E3 ubiquitin-protein ligase TRIM35-like [Pangasianodon hypophthalmus]|uniref:E3 ubiquitin-protein ligase TRIM35-like n=1 Tax=Pangasianodon hypophthalmus TaxID=310915 RepID=UPI0023073115|nr:E3 ubiquitin-protein ligase TRIM35-like [Pangasianodon hypophthalmus]